MSARDEILGALARPGAPVATAPRIGVRTVPKERLWECFCERLQALGGEVATQADLDPFAGRAVCDADVPEAVKARLGTFSDSVWEAEAGVTLAEFGVAETGSVGLVSSSGRSRLHSLAPPVHVVLLRPSDVVASLEEGLARLGSSTSVIVSGPSRTADIEGVLVRGVHGPKRLLVVPMP